MPHALILLMGDTVEATRAFHEVVDRKVPRLSLVDTFNDEQVESVRVAEALGKDLFAVRLDTPGSRRGNFLRIMREVRWELDLRGHKHVRIFLSGGLDEHQILRYNEVADAYGVGTAISNAPVVDFSMDITEVDGHPLAKRGKRSGSKRVARCRRCLQSVVLPAGRRAPGCECGGKREELLRPLLRQGVCRQTLPSAEAIRGYVLRQLEKTDLEI
jgi:nicotinate phosphoribosyltransferase